MNKTILMIHGMCGGKWCWENYKNFFEEKRYRCIIPVLRFHDVNPNDPPDSRLGTTGLLDYIDDLEKEIGNLGHAPILFGHSMGGLLAQILASRGLAKAAVLIAPVFPYGIFTTDFSEVRGVWSILTKWKFWQKPIRQNFGEAKYSMLNLLPPEKQRQVFDKFVFESGRAFSEMGFWFLDRKKASQVDESKVNCPVLLIAGKQDKIISPSVVRKTSQKYENVSTYKEFAHHAHWLIEEPGWENIAEDIHDWLSRLPID